MYAPIFYAVVKNDHQALPSMDAFIGQLPSEDEIIEMVPQSDWCNPYLHKGHDWPHGLLPAADVWDFAALDGLSASRTVDASKQWIKVTITEHSMREYSDKGFSDSLIYVYTQSDSDVNTLYHEDLLHAYNIVEVLESLMLGSDHLNVYIPAHITGTYRMR